MKSRIAWSPSFRWPAIDHYSFCRCPGAGMIMCDALFIAQIVLIFIFHVPCERQAPHRDHHTDSHNSWSFIGECCFYRSNLISAQRVGRSLIWNLQQLTQRKKVKLFSSFHMLWMLWSSSVFLKLEPIWLGSWQILSHPKRMHNSFHCNKF